MIKFARGDKVSEKDEMITISLEDRNEKLLSAQKDLERLNTSSEDTVDPGGTFRDGDYIPPGFEDATTIDQSW